MLEINYRMFAVQMAFEYFKNTNNINFQISDLTAKADEIYAYIINTGAKNFGGVKNLS